jgi:phosphoribosylglycinamide formyltransferase 1
LRENKGNFQLTMYNLLMHFIILSSSKGTTMQAVLDALHNGSLHATCLGLIADREDRGCVEKAREAGLPVTIVKKEKNEEREVYDKRIHEAIQVLSKTVPRTPYSVLRIACIGWMYLFSPWFVRQWKNTILNVHPSLLPAFPGAHAVRDALQAGVDTTGMTMHLVDEGVDTGPILVQKSCSIEKGDTEETLKKRIQELEKEWYPKVLEEMEMQETEGTQGTEGKEED